MALGVTELTVSAPRAICSVQGQSADFFSVGSDYGALFWAAYSSL